MTQKIVLLSDTTSIFNPGACLLRSGATQKDCLWPVTPNRAQATATVQSIATRTGSGFINVTPWFCDKNLCPSLINNLVPLFDGQHVTPRCSLYLSRAMETALNLNGAHVVNPQSVPTR